MPSPIPLFHPGTGGAEVIIDPERPIVVSNASGGNQSLTAVTLNYLAGSRLRVPLTRRLSDRATLRWSVVLSKTAAGIADTNVGVTLGLTGSASDTVVLVTGLGSGTAAIDVAQLDVLVVVRGGGILAGTFRVTHSLATTGWITTPGLVVPVLSTALDLSVENLIAGLVVSPGASIVSTVSVVEGAMALPLELPA